jgi:hypothetical protein
VRKKPHFSILSISDPLFCSYSVFVATVKVGEVELRAGGVYSVLVDEGLTAENVIQLFLINLFLEKF